MRDTRKRVVTGLDDQGRSIIVSAEPVPNTVDFDGWKSEEQWIIEALPPVMDEDTNTADIQDYALEPPRGGAIFRLVTFGQGTGPMHITETIDLIVVLSGDVYLIMEEGEVLLKPGDTVVQRGTNHAWENRGDQECLLAALLISASSGEN